ncbi:MAG: DUF2280 domain-containing protein [Gemmatimonadales bacterium]
MSDESTPTDRPRDRAPLSAEVRTFIVTRLAWFESPTAITGMVKEAFGLELNRSTVAYYHPESSGTGERLGAEWIELFTAARAAFVKKMGKEPISRREYRLMKLQRMLDTEEDAGNIAGARAILEQAAKEVGGLFTNRRELSGPDGGPLEVDVDDLRARLAQRVAALAPKDTATALDDPSATVSS